MINEGIAIMGIAEVKSNWSKIPIKDHTYNRTDGWLKKRRIITGYNQVTIYGGPFQSGDTSIMVVDEVLRRVIATGK